jgi:hypothetical protein
MPISHSLRMSQGVSALCCIRIPVPGLQISFLPICLVSKGIASGLLQTSDKVIDWNKGMTIGGNPCKDSWVDCSDPFEMSVEASLELANDPELTIKLCQQEPV